MSLALQVQEDQDVVEIGQVESVCQKLMTTKHYAKMGYDGVFAIVQKAKSLKMSTMDALNGGLYFVQGKVEMSAQAMNQLIRNAGHSIQKDEKSNNEICILHGKRKDNGDAWTESFSLMEARAAGLYNPSKPSAWTKYPRDMLFARALSRLARQLFPDTIKGCYVQGELSDAPSFNAPVHSAAEITPLKPALTNDQVAEILLMIHEHDDIREKLMEFVKKMGGNEIKDIEAKDFERVKKSIKKMLDEKKALEKADEVEHMSEEEMQTELEAARNAAEEYVREEEYATE